MSRTRLSFASFALASLLAFASCTQRGVVEPFQTGAATLVIRADLSGTAVATVVVEATAPDIATALVFNIPIVNRVASGTITVPAGSSRTITLRAYDAGGVQTHSGSVTVNVQAGTNPTISVVLTPLTGGLPITVTLGNLTVTVTPPSGSLGLAGNSLGLPGTVQLTAVIKDWNGNPVTGVATWATRDPGVALVDASGLVTAAGAGTTTISAAFEGATGTATVTVTH